LAADEASAQKVFDDGPRVVLGSVQCGIQSDLWIEGTLRRVVDAGETLDLAPASLGIEALAIALLARIERRIEGSRLAYTLSSFPSSDATKRSTSLPP